MIEPMFGAGTIAALGGLAVVIGIVVVSLILGAGLILLCIKKVTPGKVGVRVGISLWPPSKGRIEMSDTTIFRIPLVTEYQEMDVSVKRLEIERKGIDGLICADNIRADIVVAFYMRVNFPAVHYVNAEGVEVDPESAEGRAILEASLEAPHRDRFKEVKRVAQSVTCERASDPAKLQELFEAKFSEALKTAGKLMEFRDLYTKRQDFRTSIIKVIGHDLDGYILTDVAIDYLEQTPLDQHDPTNVLDAEGIRKITEETAKATEDTNARTREKEAKINDQNKRNEQEVNDQNRSAEINIKNQDTDAEVEKRALDQRNEEDLAKRTRAVDEAKATEGAAAEKVVQESRSQAEMAQIQADELIKVRKVNEDRAVQEAQVDLEKDLLRLEQQKIQEGQHFTVQREQTIGVEEQDKEAAIIERSLDVAKQNADLEAAQKEVVVQGQLKKDEEAKRTAERAREVLNIEAQARAEAEQKKDIIAAAADYDVRSKKADADKYEGITSAEKDKLKAEQKAEEIQIEADAKAKASEKRNHAMQQEAEGTAAMQSASGYAEANVIKAKAEAKTVDAAAEKAQGLAEADVIQAQGLASGKAKAAEGEGDGKAIEAKGVAEGKSVEAVKLAEAKGAKEMGLAAALAKTEMAKAIEKFNKASQEHEEFRLELDKDKAVELADIAVKKDIADAQARVVGEALKSANIDLVGGEQDFFDRVVGSVSQGKVVDRLVDSSQTITDVKNTFFNGDPDYLKNKLAGWIKTTGLKTEDVKNLTISALLASMVSKTDDNSLRGLMKTAQKAVRGTEIGSSLASTILGDKAGK